MKMKWSLYLGKIAGIKIYIHWSFIFLLGWILIANFQMGYSLYEGLAGIGFVLIIFTCVVLHELGHALTAKRYGIKTKNITLLPIGGLANMERMPEKPGQELLVAIMGPFVNVVIALALYLYLSATGGIPTMEELAALQEEGYSLLVGGYFLFYLMIINVILVLFNILPAFPMDGGRMLRAMLSYKFDRATATKIAARIGQVIAVLFVIIGFYANFWLIFIGIFIFFGAGVEALFETTKSMLSKFKVRDVTMTSYTILSPQDTIGKAVKTLLEGQEREFLVGEENEVQGVLTRNEIIKGLNERGKETIISEVMRKDFITLQPGMELKDAYQTLMVNPCSMAPVFEDDVLIGVLDQENINELVMVSKALDH